MKSNKLLELIAIGMITLGASNAAFAQSNDTKGGGLGVYTSEGFKLYDLVDPSTCTWQTGSDLLASQEEVQGYLAKIKKLNWYLEMKLRAEIKNIDFCWTKGQLKEPITGRPPELMIFQRINHVPIGIRLINTKTVYVQADRYQELGANDRALFIIHEALHTFIPLNAPDRYHSLESMVASIGRIQGDLVHESTSFNTTIKRSHLTIPSEVSFISDQNFFQYTFANHEDRKAMIMSGEIQQKELLGYHEFEYIKELSDEDQDFLNEVKSDPKTELLEDFCKFNEQEVIAKLDEQKTNSFQMSVYCLGAPGYINKIVNNTAQNMPALTKYLGDFYQNLNSVTVSIKNDRVIVSKNADILSGNPAINPRYRYALEVKPAFQSAKLNDAHPQLIQFARTLVASATSQPVDQWIKTVNQDDAFITAFNFNPIQTALGALHSPISDESAASALNLKGVYTSALKGMIQMLRNESLDDHADRLIKLINEKNIGIKIGE